MGRSTPGRGMKRSRSLREGCACPGQGTRGSQCPHVFELGPSDCHAAEWTERGKGSAGHNQEAPRPCPSPGPPSVWAPSPHNQLLPEQSLRCQWAPHHPRSLPDLSLLLGFLTQTCRSSPGVIPDSSLPLPLQWLITINST